MMICAQFCVEEGGEEGYEILLFTILKVIAALLVDPKQEVKGSTHLQFFFPAQSNLVFSCRTRCGQQQATRWSACLGW